jgi:1,4-alpha-glucan branching enzyme
VNQLKAFADSCHRYGIAVIFDVVCNHAGGGLDPQSLDWIDLPAAGGENAYFSRAERAGGRVFAFDRPPVARYLTDNALLSLEAYHAAACASTRSRSARGSAAGGSART